jgi:hypothetical protein
MRTHSSRGDIRYDLPTMTAPQPRPRVVTAAFWCWVVASFLLVLFGLLLALSRANIPVFLRGAGVLFLLAGLALVSLAGRARAGNAGLRRAAVGLALPLVVLLAIFSVMVGGVVWPFVIVLTLAGTLLMMRPAANDWFDSEERQ